MGFRELLQGLFRARTPEAQEALERYMKVYKRYIDINNSIALNILIWGPSLRSKTRVANKRKDIYAALLKQGHNAMLSEELISQEEYLQEGLPSLKMLEFAQASAADLIIILLGGEAMGAIGETHDFGDHPDLAWKVFVLAPKTYQDGYSGHGVLYLLEQGYGGVYWYDESEIESCKVLAAALIRVQARREIYAGFARVPKDGQSW